MPAFPEQPADVPVVPPLPELEAAPAPASGWSDKELLDIFKKFKKESFESRHIWERNWMRNIHYVNNRQWITYVTRSNEWRDVRLASWVPRPVTNKCAEGLQSLRAMFASVNIGVNVRPVGTDPLNVAVAATADELQPLLHEEHHMDDVMNESDYWFIVTGNTFLHTFFERDAKHGTIDVPVEQCVACGESFGSDEIASAGQACPSCGAAEGFTPVTDVATGEPAVNSTPKGKGVTICLSPFEIAFPNTYARFSDVPGVLVMRWRTRNFYEDNPRLKEQVAGRNWQKAPSETSMQLFRSLPFSNDIGVAPFLNAGGSSSMEEGAVEYEMWLRPNDVYPEGLVVRVLGDADPVVLHLEEDEALPGPLPYRDNDGMAIFPFTHAAFEQRGGRVYGTSPLDVVIPKQNQLNQLDSQVQMTIQRMANPLWLVPKGAEIEKFTGQPGLVVKWNPLTVGGNAKPERVDGIGPGAWTFQLRDQYLKDIEELLGTFDIIKGSKPAGVEAFSAMQLLVERSQSRFSSAFQARGKLYRDVVKFQLEIEREFGPDERTAAVLSPNNAWTMETYKNASLHGSFTIVVEDGSNTPKSALGMRASVEHLNQLGFIDPTDPDQKYKIYQMFGQAKLSPSLDVHMNAALQKQQAFEDWAKDPAAQQQSFMVAQAKVQEYQQQIGQLPEADPLTGAAPALPPPPSATVGTPLEWKPWYDAGVHRTEFLKWANGDRVRKLLSENQALEKLIAAHLQDINMAFAETMALTAPQPAPAGAAGASRALQNSNQESGAAETAPSSQTGAA